MLGVGGFVAIGYDRLPPRTVGVRTLVSRSIGTGVGIICVGHTLAPVGTVSGRTASVGPGVRIVGSTGRGPSVRTVNPVGNSVGAGVCIIVSTYSISTRVRTIDGVSANGITIVRPIVIAGAAGKDRSNGGASDKSSKVSRSVARLDSPLGSSGLSHVGNVVNRRAGRNRIDLFRHRIGRCP